MDTHEDDELMTLTLDRVTLCRDRYLPLWQLRELAGRVAGSDRERAAVKPLLEAMVMRDAEDILAVLREIQDAFSPPRGAHYFPRLNSLALDVAVLIRAIEEDIMAAKKVHAADKAAL